MENGSLPTRQELAKEYQWKLEDIYATNEDWEKDFQHINVLLEELTPLRGTLGSSASHLLKALQLEDALQEKLEKVYTYARMRRDEDNTNPTYQALTDRADGISVKVDTALSFMVPEILAIPENTLQSFQKQEKGLALYAFLLAELMRQKPHVLSGPEEEIIARAGEIAQSPDNIFRMINHADLQFSTILDDKGKEVEVTHGRYTQLMESQNRRVRQDAFQSLYGAYGTLKNTLAATYSSSVKKDVFYAKVRKYASSLEGALFGDNVPVNVYENLIQTVRSNLNQMHRYVALRKKMLALDELHMYDLYVPIVKNVDWEIPYPQAIEMVKAGLHPLGQEYLNILCKGLASGWIDVYENRGKTSGAYSWGPYGVHPYVLLNYQNNLNNVFTLAHEMGHAMHSYFSDHEQPYTYAHYTIFTAEVASTVNESLLMHYLLQKEQNRDKKMYLLHYYLEQFRGTIYRQTMFAEFEKITHEKVEAGEALTPELLCTIYRQLNEDYYGPLMMVDKEIDIEWARIPHFYTAFYVYKYATGFSAATALSNQILNQGEEAVSRYLNFLKKGGSDYPISLLKGAGVDMASPQPIQEALHVFAQFIDQLEALAIKN